MPWLHNNKFLKLGLLEDSTHQTEAEAMGLLAPFASMVSVRALFQRLFSTDTSLGADATYARASTAMVTDHEDILREVPANAARFDGARVVRNLVTASEDLQDASWITSGTASATAADTVSLPATNDQLYSKFFINPESLSFVVRVKLSGAGTTRLRIISNAIGEVSGINITLTSTPTVYSVAASFAATDTGDATISILKAAGLTATEVTVTEAQAENTTGSDDPTLPGSYVSVGVATGDELVTDGGFDDAGEWTLGSQASVSGGVLTLTGNGTYNAVFQQDVGAIVGKTYVIVYEVVSNSLVGTGQQFLISSLGFTGSTDTAPSTVGTHTLVEVAASTNDLRLLLNNTQTSGSLVLDNVSVKEASHGAFVDGVLFSPRVNGNTVASNVVTEATGALISPAPSLLMEPAATNQLLNSTAPATQTTGSLGTGDYVCWMEGSDSVAVTAGTATITGGGTATDGTPDLFTVTGAGTVTVTVTGSPDRFQLEAGSVPTSFIETAGAAATRVADTLSYPLTTPQSEGMAICKLQFGFDAASIPAGNFGILSASSATPYTWQYFDLTNFKVNDGSTNGFIAHSISADTDMFIATYWNSTKYGMGRNKAGSWSWGSENNYDGAFVSNDRVSIGQGNTAGPLLIESIAVYNTDEGTDWIEDNF